MSDSSALKTQCQKIVRKAFRSLNTARRNIDEGDYDFGSSRAYYAAFYAIQAVVLTKNLSFSKHSGVIGAFNQFFVKTGLFPKEFSKMISRLFRERQISDYDFVLNITERDALQDADFAETILKSIKKYLSELNLL